MVAAGSLDGLDFACEDPVFERGVAHADLFSGLTRGEESGRGHEVESFLRSHLNA